MYPSSPVMFSQTLLYASKATDIIFHIITFDDFHKFLAKLILDLILLFFFKQCAFIYEKVGNKNIRWSVNWLLHSIVHSAAAAITKRGSCVKSLARANIFFGLFIILHGLLTASGGFCATER